MPTFRCKINSANGRVIERILIAPTKSSLKDHLEHEGNFVFDIRRVGGFGAFLKKGKTRKRIKPKDFQVFNQEFSVLIKAGLPIIAALDTIIEKEAEDELTDVLKEIRKEIAGGASLSEAFRQYTHIFSNLYIASLRAGEKSGNLSTAIIRYIEYLKKISEIRQKIISASIYPLILTVVSVFVVLFLLIYVVPSFTQTYFETGTELPSLTLFLVGFSNAVKSRFAYFLALAVALGLGYTYGKRTEGGKALLDKLKLKLPFLGDLYLEYSLSKFSRTLATVLHGGMPLVDSLRISTGTLDNMFLKSKLDEAADNIEKGTGFSESLVNTGAFPKLALSMVEAGEKSGALEQVLNDVAEYYESNVDTKLSILTSSIEPALMVIMGLVIGFIVLAMYLPIFQMAGAVG